MLNFFVCPNLRIVCSRKRYWNDTSIPTASNVPTCAHEHECTHIHLYITGHRQIQQRDAVAAVSESGPVAAAAGGAATTVAPADAPHATAAVPGAVAITTDATAAERG